MSPLPHRARLPGTFHLQRASRKLRLAGLPEDDVAIVSLRAVLEASEKRGSPPVSSQPHAPRPVPQAAAWDISSYVGLGARQPLLQDLALFSADLQK